MKIDSCELSYPLVHVKEQLTATYCQFQELQEAIPECKANIVTYTGIMDAYGKARKYEEMERVWKTMKDLYL